MDCNLICIDEALADVGLPPTATLADLIQHHRGNAALAGAADMMAADLQTLQELRDSLPTGHQELPGIIRAIEVLRHAR